MVSRQKVFNSLLALESFLILRTRHTVTNGPEQNLRKMTKNALFSRVFLILSCINSKYVPKPHNCNFTLNPLWILNGLQTSRHWISNLNAEIGSKWAWIDVIARDLMSKPSFSEAKMHQKKLIYLLFRHRCHLSLRLKHARRCLLTHRAVFASVSRLSLDSS